MSLCRHCVLALFFVGLPVLVQAQFTFITNNNSITITGYTGSGGAVVVPAMTNGYPVTSIGSDAFDDCSSLTSVTIPNSVTSIGEGAFGACLNLASVTLPNSIASIEPEVFSDCEKLTSVTIPDSVTSIGEEAFMDCSGLASVTIPNSVSTIGQNAFFDCTSLRQVTIPSSVTSLGELAFSFCTSLNSAYFLGNAPPDSEFFGYFSSDPAIVYYLPGTTGWGSMFGAVSTKLWFQSQPAVLSFEPSFGLQNGQFRFLVSWATNASVVVQACTNLVNPVWIPVATNALSSGTNYFGDTQWTSYPNRYYRVSGP